MKESSVKRLGLILAIQAEIEAMKIENYEREVNGLAMAYDSDAFFRQSNELRNIVHLHEDEL